MAIRTFTAAETHRFAEFSGDFNPLHCDPVAARRRLGGRQLVHGLFVTLWALDEVLDEAIPG
jgi:acyl dehydratase